MKKSAVLVLVALSITALGLTLIPHVFSQPENVEILSYRYYMSPYSSDYLIVVGEAQNNGPNVIDYVVVTGTFYAPDGTVFMSNFNKAFITQILPQQKTPFYIAFSPANIVSDTNWTSQDVTNSTITVSYADPTETRQYQDLTVISDSASTDEYGYYMVTGTIKNTGSQPSNRTWVVATFYNSTGGTVAVGYTAYLTPTSIPAGGTASFTIYPTDYEAVVANIASYSLIIQTELTAPPATPTPSPSSTASPTPTPSSSSPTSTPTPTPTASGNGTALPDTYVYIVAIVVVMVVVGVVVFVLRKRAGKRAAIPQEQAE